MFFNKVINHQGGWEILNEQKPKQLQSMLDSLFSISPEMVQSSLRKQIENQISSEVLKIKKSNELISRYSEEMHKSDDLRVRSMIHNAGPSDESSVRAIGKNTIEQRYESLGVDINSEIFSKADIESILSRSQNYAANRNFITSQWNLHVKSNDWSPHIVESPDSKKINIHIKHLQERISIKLLIDQKANLANWIYAETKKAHEAGACDVSVILVPMDSYVKSYIGNHNVKNSFETIKNNLDILSPIKALNPFVIIGFSDIEREIKTYDSVWSEDALDPDNLIDKCIEFSPEHYQAGMGILSYFGEIIKTKHPDIQATVKIEQDGNFVRLHIETEDGTKEIIEKTLEDYTLVVTNQAPIETLFENRIEIMALQNKLEIAAMEIRQTRDMLALSRDNSSSRILSLEDEIQHLRSQIGSQISIANKSNNIIEMQAETSNKMAIELIDSSKLLIHNIITNNPMHSDVKDALTLINNKLESDITESDAPEIITAIETINENSPSIFKELEVALKNTAYGVSGNIVYKWFTSIANAMC